jgi:hypothetical protein
MDRFEDLRLPIADCRLKRDGEDILPSVFKLAIGNITPSLFPVPFFFEKAD